MIRQCELWGIMLWFGNFTQAMKPLLNLSRIVETDCILYKQLLLLANKRTTQETAYSAPAQAAQRPEAWAWQKGAEEGAWLWGTPEKQRMKRKWKWTRASLCCWGGMKTELGRSEQVAVEPHTRPRRCTHMYTETEDDSRCASYRKAKLIVQFSSVAQSCPTLYDPMNRSTPGLPVHHQLP